LPATGTHGLIETDLADGSPLRISGAADPATVSAAINLYLNLTESPPRTTSSDSGPALLEPEKTKPGD
jgi:hypothetical protein